VVILLLHCKSSFGDGLLDLMFGSVNLALDDQSFLGLVLIQELVPVVDEGLHPSLQALNAFLVKGFVHD
jgi:hypothetical protein